MSSQIFKNSFYYMLASFLPTAVGFIMLPIYSRYLSPDDYGIVALVLSFQMFLPLILSLKLDSSLSRFYFEYKDKDLKIFISTILLVIFIFSIIFSIIIYVNLDSIISFVFPKTPDKYFLLFEMGLIISFLSIFNNFLKNLIRVREKAKLFMKIQLCLFFFNFTVNIIEVIVLERGAYGIIEASLIYVILSLIIYIYVNKDYFILYNKLIYIVDPIKFSLPLIPHSLSGLIFMYSDRIILEKHVTLSAIGLYMFSDKIAMVFKMIVNEFNAAFSPYFVRKSKESREKAIEETHNISLIFIYILSMLIVFLALFSVEVVYILLDDRYFDTWMMIPLLSSAYIFRSLYCFSSSGLFFEKKTGKVAIITIFAGVANIGLNIVLIPHYGIMVAIYTTIFSFFITFLMSELISYKIYYLKLMSKKNIIIVSYMFISIFFSLYLNKSFLDFGLIEYLYKFIVLAIGFGIGYKLKLFNIDKLLKIKG
ncbi:lipopolysaccharide biosynthesis protein [Poseidonibacter lekithochrous]|uniref:lipopolysaccharide biosynthesis protein n=1 Tax=Poseidonibacter lekithochrous TaxID=1904463 RepID=UPI0008FC791B|nr:oligosaccharide flippase family protein [Poseidonibacter lekithochrous]QKJ22266.1 putative polysaccharide export protein [Poseidonibacter lekithochrous]